MFVVRCLAAAHAEAYRSLPAHHWTAVATTTMAGISQSIVSMYIGTYISTMRPRPVANAVCHLRFIRDSSRSRAALPSASSPPDADSPAPVPPLVSAAVGWWRGVAEYP